MNKTLDLIKKCIGSCERPVVLCSFGKDSLVLLNLVRRIKPDVDIIYWREPFFQKKYTHSEQVAKELDLNVYDYPPTYTDYLQNGDWFDVINYYYVNGKDWLNLFTGCVDFQEDKPFVCAVNDLLNRPKVPAYSFKWDCIFHGHKQQDNETEYISKEIGMDTKELKDFVLFDNKKIMVLPIKDWTDDDIWRYIKDNELSYNKQRYDENKDEFNNDKFPTCFRCLDYRTKGKMVYCPKKKREILNIAKSKEEQKITVNKFLHTSYFKEG